MTGQRNKIQKTGKIIANKHCFTPINVHQFTLINEHQTHLQSRVLVVLVGHMLAEPHVMVHPLDEKDVAGGEDGMLPGATVSETTAARLEIEGAVDNILRRGKKRIAGGAIRSQLAASSTKASIYLFRAVVLTILLRTGRFFVIAARACGWRKGIVPRLKMDVRTPSNSFLFTSQYSNSSLPTRHTHLPQACGRQIGGRGRWKRALPLADPIEGFWQSKKNLTK